MKLCKLATTALCILWCGAFPTALFAVWALNLNIGEAINLLGCTSILGLVAGLLHDHL
jgi:hypothetical protein